MRNSRFFSVIYMFLITLACTTLVSAVHILNQDRIALNENLRLQAVVLDVLGIRPPAKQSKESLAELFTKRIRVKEIQGRTVYVGLLEDGRTVKGYAFRLSGPGFWGPIYAMMGVDPGLTKVIGIAFYQHSETPGLGGRISESWFRQQFIGRPLVRSTKNGDYFFLKKAGTGKSQRDLDAITGATGTSNKLQILLNTNLRDILPWLQRLKSRGLI